MDSFIRSLMFAVVVAMVALGSEGAEIPTAHSCELAAAGMDPTDFVTRAIGGSVDCTESPNAVCCDTVRGVFAEGGSAELCLCSSVFFSSMMMSVPAIVGVSPDRCVDMLIRCGVPVVGRSSCPGTEEDSDIEPQIQGQTLLKGFLLGRVVGAARNRFQQSNQPSPAKTRKTKSPSPSSSPSPVPRPVPIRTQGSPVVVVAQRAPPTTPPPQPASQVVVQQIVPSPPPQAQIPRFVTPSPLGPQFVSPPVFPKQTGDRFGE